MWNFMRFGHWTKLAFTVVSIYQEIYLLPHAFLLLSVRSQVTSGSQSYWYWFMNIHRIASEKEHTWEPTACAFGGRNNGWHTKIIKFGMYIAHSNHIRGKFVIALLLGKPLSILNKGSELAAQTSDFTGSHIFHLLVPEFVFSPRMF